MFYTGKKLEGMVNADKEGILLSNSIRDCEFLEDFEQAKNVLEETGLKDFAKQFKKTIQIEEYAMINGRTSGDARIYIDGRWWRTLDRLKLLTAFPKNIESGYWIENVFNLREAYKACQNLSKTYIRDDVHVLAIRMDHFIVPEDAMDSDSEMKLDLACKVVHVYIREWDKNGNVIAETTEDQFLSDYVGPGSPTYAEENMKSRTESKKKNKAPEPTGPAMPFGSTSKSAISIMSRYFTETHKLDAKTAKSIVENSIIPALQLIGEKLAKVNHDQMSDMIDFKDGALSSLNEDQKVLISVQVKNAIDKMATDLIAQSTEMMLSGLTGQSDVNVGLYAKSALLTAMATIIASAFNDKMISLVTGSLAKLPGFAGMDAQGIKDLVKRLKKEIQELQEEEDD